MHRNGAIIGEWSLKRFRHSPACARIEDAGTKYACNCIGSYKERTFVKEQ